MLQMHNPFLSTRFLLQYGTHITTPLQYCWWDCKGIAPTDCSLQEVGTYIGVTLPSSSALISYKMVNAVFFLKLYNDATCS